MLGANKNPTNQMLSYLAVRVGESLSLKELWKAQGLAEGYCLRMLHKDLGLDECCRYQDLMETLKFPEEISQC